MDLYVKKRKNDTDNEKEKKRETGEWGGGGGHSNFMQELDWGKTEWSNPKGPGEVTLWGR